jgi:hypothetical protein
MSDDVSAENAAQSSDDLASLLAKRGTKTRAKSTSILIGVLLLLIGVLVGVGIGRASTPPPADGPQTSQTDERPRGGPFGGRSRD